MEEKTLNFASIFLVILAALLFFLLPYFPKLHIKEEEAREAWLAQEEFAAQQMEMQSLEIRKDTDVSTGPEGQLTLKLPENIDGSMVEVTNDYVTQTIRVQIPGADENYFENEPIVGSSNHIDNLSYARKGDVGILEIGMDRVYELDMSYGENNCYYNFLTPQEVYDKVVVIDAGHGGRAPGATKQGVKEKDIDLAIALQLKTIFEQSDENIGVYFTRTDDSNPTFDQRVQLANKAGANLFISIHNNSTGSGRMSATNGTQVMYDETSEKSRVFARICLEEVTAAIGSTDKGLVEGDSIYIIRTSEVPVALIEVGFMTNREELELLKTEDYQRKTAQGIYNAILRAFEEGY